MSAHRLLNYAASAAGAYSPHAHITPLMVRAAESEPATILPDPANLTGGYVSHLVGNSAKFAHGLAGVNQPQNFLFAAVVGLTLAGLIVATFFVRWTMIGITQVRFLLTHSDKGGQRYWSRNHTLWWPAIKKHLLYAPIWKVRHNREIQLSKAMTMGTLPSRFHTLLLIVYFAFNIAYCLVLDWGQESASILADLRGRSGELAIINMVPTILFALRNNPLIFILRVPYDTFNLFHRWCARMFVLQSVVHTVVFAINVGNAGGGLAFLGALQYTTSYRWGMVGTCVLVGIVILAFSPLRHAFYETFVNFHRVLVLLSLIAVYIHIEKSKLPQLPYLRTVFAFWFAEWATRLYTLYHNNISARKGLTKVTVEALPSEACRVTFELARPWQFKPSTHVHVWLPKISGWASHPFSVAWSETTLRRPSLENMDLEKLPSYGSATASPNPAKLPPATLSKGARATVVEPTRAQEVDLRSVNSSQAVTTVSLIIRARTGMTRQLYMRAASSPTGLLHLHGGIEGPYGGHETFSSYGTVLLFAGGVGITHCLSHLKHLLTQYGEGACATRRILLVWSVPNTEALEWVRPWMDTILRMEGRKEVLRIQLFVTKPRHQNEIRSNTGTVQMFPGRCVPATVVEKEMADRVGAMGVAVCGPGAFADSVRAAVRGRVGEGSVDFIEEAFTY